MRVSRQIVLSDVYRDFRELYARKKLSKSKTKHKKYAKPNAMWG